MKNYWLDGLAVSMVKDFIVFIYTFVSMYVVKSI